MKDGRLGHRRDASDGGQTTFVDEYPGKIVRKLHRPRYPSPFALSSSSSGCLRDVLSRRTEKICLGEFPREAAEGERRIGEEKATRRGEREREASFFSSTFLPSTSAAGINE